MHPRAAKKVIMEQISLVRAILARTTIGWTATSAAAKDVLGWAREHAPAVLGLTHSAARKLSWVEFRRLIGEDLADLRGSGSEPMRLAMALSRLLGLDETDKRITMAILGIDRDPLLASLAAMLDRHRIDNFCVIQAAAGLESGQGERQVRKHPLCAYALVDFERGTNGHRALYVRWSLERLLDRMPDDEAGIIEALVGARMSASLDPESFAHIPEFDLLVRLLKGAARERAPGVCILLHGPPGTGKTEMARTLAREAGLVAYAVGEAPLDFDEPTRGDRVSALRMGHALLGKRPGGLLVFDEMEDLSGDAERTSFGTIRRRSGSKVFINRVLETGEVPVIWITNSIEGIDPAIIRRMSFVLHCDYPRQRAASNMVRGIATEEGVDPANGLVDLAEQLRETSTVARVAARAARLAGEADGGSAIAQRLVKSLRGGTLPQPEPGVVDLSLYEADRPIAELCGRLATQGAKDVSLLLSGPPGTGKTALAYHFARMLDRPLTMRRPSDLLSKWVGETERRIAEAFAQAREEESVLFFDEADSLLFDRTTAHANWEIGQVNEMLGWLDRHPYPVIAATNFDQRLDPATVRRFVYKVTLKAMGPEKAFVAYRRFFQRKAPLELASIGGLTPGDFAVVARQLRHEGTLGDSEILVRLREEIDAKGAKARIGF